MKLEDAISLLLDSSIFQSVAPVAGQNERTKQEVYGFSVKLPNQRSQSFGFVQDGTELFLAFLGAGDDVRELDDRDKISAETVLVRWLRQAVVR